MRRLQRRSGGWTMVEIMIVVLIIGILLAIATPNFIYARERSRQKACIANLRLIDSAKEQWAMDYRARDGATVTMTNLLNVYLDNGSFGSRSRRRGTIEPRCPSSNLPYRFTINPIGTPPDCPTFSAQSGDFAHNLP